MARTRLTNPTPLVELQFNPYQAAFFAARRLRVCPGFCTDDTKGGRLEWSMLDSLVCPQCGKPGLRAFRRFELLAGRRGGKTRAGAIAAVEEAMCVPNSTGWCCAPSYPELEDYVLPAFFSILPTEIFEHPLTEWSEDRLWLKLPNGAQVSFRSLDDPSRGAGPGLDWAWIDEARKIEELAWHILRPALTERKGIAFVTTTPDWGEDWVYRNFFQPALDGRPGYWACHYKTVDNPIIDPEEVEQARQTMPPELFRREYEASIEYPTGTIFPSHLIDASEADDEAMTTFIAEWPRIDVARPSIGAIDPGTDHPFAAGLIIATPKGLAVVAEYLERRKPFFQHAANLKHMVAPVQVERWAIDGTQPQAAIELAQHGVFAQLVRGGPGSVAAGIQRIYAWMATGRMRISRTRCPRLLKELRAYRYADLPENAKGLPKDAVPYKVADDLVDMLRYGVMLWPELPAPIDLDGLEPGKRNLALLTADARRQIERNVAKDDQDDLKEGLIRVTDDFSVLYNDEVPLRDSGMSDFYR